jgi:hypothetical protein
VIVSLISRSLTRIAGQVLANECDRCELHCCRQEEQEPRSTFGKPNPMLRQSTNAVGTRMAASPRTLICPVDRTALRDTVPVAFRIETCEANRHYRERVHSPYPADAQRRSLRGFRDPAYVAMHTARWFTNAMSRAICCGQEVVTIVGVPSVKPGLLFRQVHQRRGPKGHETSRRCLRVAGFLRITVRQIYSGFLSDTLGSDGWCVSISTGRLSPLGLAWLAILTDGGG